MRRSAIIAALSAGLLLSGPGGACAESLYDAWAAALATNGQLGAAELQSEAADFDVEAARAGRLPVAAVSGYYSVRSDERHFIFNNPLLPGQEFITPYAQRDAAGAIGVVKMPLYASGRIKNSIRSAEARATAAEHASAMSRLELLLAVGQAYVRVLRARCEQCAADDNLASLSAHEAEVRSHFDQQCATTSDMLAAQVSTSTAAQLCLQRNKELATAGAAFNRLVGRRVEASVDLDELALPPVAGALEDLHQVGWRQRPDLAELRATAEAHRFEAERIRSTARPEVSANGRYDFEENRYQTPQGIASAAVVVDWRLYDGASRKGASAELSRASSLGRLADDLRAQIALEIFTARNCEQEATARMAVTSASLERAAENVRVSKLRYAHGQATSSEVLDAQARRAQAVRDHDNARYDYCLAQIQLLYAMGILGPAP
jgi:outer membrane protein TolC